MLMILRHMTTMRSLHVRILFTVHPVWHAPCLLVLYVGFVRVNCCSSHTRLFSFSPIHLSFRDDKKKHDIPNHQDLAFFDLLEPLGNFWHVTVLIIVTALAASTVDTLQTAIASVISSDIIRFGVADSTARWISRCLLILINIPAIILSSKRFDVIGLFLVADLVCATAVLPVFLGLMTNDIGFIAAPTELGAFMGILSGFAAVLVNGKIIGFDQAINSITGEVIASGPFSYFWLTNSSQCALCGTTTMTTFIIVPLVAGFFALFFSKLDVIFRGDRAREPIFKFAQPQLQVDQTESNNVSKEDVSVTEAKQDELVKERAFSDKAQEDEFMKYLNSTIRGGGLAGGDNMNVTSNLSPVVEGGEKVAAD